MAQNANAVADEDVTEKRKTDETVHLKKHEPRAAQKSHRCRARRRFASAALRAVTPCQKINKTVLDSKTLIGVGFSHKF